MAFKLRFAALYVFFLIQSFDVARSKHVMDVTKHGMKGPGVPDITQALASAWSRACNSLVPSTVLIPRGTYKLNEIFLMGPCKTPMELQMDGILLAPIDPSKFKPKGSWITFKNIDHFTFHGHGTLDGQGAAAWSQCMKSSCSNMPVNLRFQTTSHGIVRGITSLNSKHFHACITDSNNLTISHINIQAPVDSPNTDGLHISNSSDVTVMHSTIATGDDCIAMLHGDHRVNISRVTCGPGHGISIGSLGKYEDEGPVHGITVEHCNFINTDNGVRVKTWPNHRHGSASNILFEDITMTNVSNPIFIDQTYCSKGNCNGKGSSGIKIRDIRFKKIHGTSATAEAVKLMCSNTMPCEGVEMSDIDINYLGTEGRAKSVCSNVKPKCFGKQHPPICVGPQQLKTVLNN